MLQVWRIWMIIIISYMAMSMSNSIQRAWWLQSICQKTSLSEIMACRTYSASLVNQHQILIALSSWRAHLALIMSLMIEHEAFSQYDPHEIPSEIMSCHRYHASLMNQNEIPIELSWKKKLLHIKMSSPCENRKLTAPLTNSFGTKYVLI